MLLNIAYAILILVCASSLFGLIFFDNLVKKIFAMSICYLNTVILIFLVSNHLQKAQEINSLLVALLILFTMNLTVAILALRNCL